MIRLILAVTFALAPTAALACSFDVDCNPGSKCVKRNSYSAGVCVGGTFPGETSEQRQNRNPYQWRQRSTEGAQCQFSTDCDAGQMCLKEAGRLYGACIRR